MNVPDIEAMIDVVHDLRDNSDTLDAERSVDMRRAADLLRAAAVELRDFADMQLCKLMEFGDEMERDGMLYKIGNAGKWQWDHDAIATAVACLASDSPHAAHAVAMMQEIYVSPSTDAKVGQLERYGIPVDPMRDWVNETVKKVEAGAVKPMKVKRVKVTPLMKGDQ